MISGRPKGIICFSPLWFTIITLLSIVWFGCTEIRIFDDIGELEPSGGTQAEGDTGTASSTDTDASLDTTSASSDEPTDTHTDTPTDSAMPCPARLADRLELTNVDVDDDIRYGKPGYNLVHLDARISLEVTTDGGALVAWVNDALDAVHVTPLDDALERGGDDTVVEGADLGGLVVHDDGFAVLTRREDPGEDIAVQDEDRPTMAAYLVRYDIAGESFALPLTGTAGIDGVSDYSNGFSGQLKWNGDHYGAYFEVRGGTGHSRSGIYWDKLVVMDDVGNAATGGWSRRCGIVRGILLYPETDGFSAYCLSDNMPDPPGLYLTSDDDAPVLLSREDNWEGYSGGSFGNAVKTGGGENILVWGSRGWDTLMDAHDISLIQMDEAHSIISDPVWLTTTADVDEVNVHAAPYGADRLLVIWNAISNLICDTGTCFGDFEGTHFQLFATDGTPLTEPEIIPAPPTGEQDLAVYPNGDLAWAFVNEEPDYSQRLIVSTLPKQRTLSIARLPYCEE